MTNNIDWFKFYRILDTNTNPNPQDFTIASFALNELYDRYNNKLINEETYIKLKKYICENMKDVTEIYYANMNEDEIETLNNITSDTVSKLVKTINKEGNIPT